MSRMIVLRRRPKSPTFAERLEALAMRAVRHALRETADSPVRWTVVSDLALALDQLRQVRHTHARFHVELRQLEADLQAELRRFTPGRFDYRLDAYQLLRERIRTRQLNLRQARRQLILAEQESTRSLHDRLLTGLTRQRYLGVLHDDRETRA